MQELLNKHYNESGHYNSLGNTHIQPNMRLSLGGFHVEEETPENVHKH